VTGRHEQVARRGYALGRVLGTAEEREEQRDELVAHVLVNRPVVVEHGPTCDRVEPIEQRPNSLGDIPSASVVEPRISAKSIVASISAPP
jgi:hypothetical protein